MKLEPAPAPIGAPNFLPDAHPRPIIRPRLLNAGEAAAYLGYRSTDVLRDIPVKPISLRDTGNGSPRWCRRALDQWLDSLTGAHTAQNDNAEDDPDSALLAWRIRRGR